MAQAAQHGIEQAAAKPGAAMAFGDAQCEDFRLACRKPGPTSPAGGALPALFDAGGEARQNLVCASNCANSPSLDGREALFTQPRHGRVVVAPQFADDEFALADIGE